MFRFLSPNNHDSPWCSVHTFAEYQLDSVEIMGCDDFSFTKVFLDLPELFKFSAFPYDREDIVSISMTNIIGILTEISNL